VLQEKSRGGSCFYQALPSEDVKAAKTDEEASKAFAVLDIQKENLYNLVFNTEERKNKKDKNYEKYMTTYGDAEGPICDIDPLSLPN
jgi:hypothetical protein